MTTPLEASSLPTRTAEFRPAASQQASPMPPASAPARRGAAPQAPPAPDHLALIQALIRAGQFTRGIELLDAVWHHELQDEHCWYLRLWLLAGQGRVLEALELARVATGHLPGSAAIAYLQAALECSAGDPEAAVESALRAAAIAPGRAEPEAMLELLLNGRDVRTEDAADPPARPGVSDPPVNPVAAALAGLALLHPSDSGLAFRPGLPAFEPPVAADRDRSADHRRIALIAAATVVAAIWAVREPLLATAGLAAVVAWLSRPSRSRQS